MLVAESSRAALEASESGIWWLRLPAGHAYRQAGRQGGWAAGRVRASPPAPGDSWRAGITDRRAELACVAAALPRHTEFVRAEQVHGSSVAVVGRGQTSRMLAGCDALLTAMPGVALTVRTADCLPVFFADPDRGAIGLAHVGWRGLTGWLLARVVAAFHHAYQTPPGALRVAIGPGIRSCCYEVGPEFTRWFGPFVQVRGGRRTCDLVGTAMEQLARCGISVRHIMDTGSCTACDPTRWFSFRRDGESAGRLLSFILIPTR